MDDKTSFEFFTFLGIFKYPDYEYVCFGGFQDILLAEFEVLSLRHLMNKSLNLCGKIEYYGVACVRSCSLMHTVALPN